MVSQKKSNKNSKHKVLPELVNTSSEIGLVSSELAASNNLEGNALYEVGLINSELAAYTVEKKQVILRI